MHPEFRKLTATVSALPLGLAHGLDVYLKDFPHGCSEQITSGAFCRLVLADEADFGLTAAEVNAQLENTFSRSCAAGKTIRARLVIGRRKKARRSASCRFTRCTF